MQQTTYNWSFLHEKQLSSSTSQHIKNLRPSDNIITLHLHKQVEHDSPGERSPIQVYAHQDDHAPPTYEMIPGFKPFTLYNF